MIEQVLDDWWKKWKSKVFQSLVPAYKWHKKYKEIQLRYAVFRHDENAVQSQERLGRVKETIPSTNVNIVDNKNAKFGSNLKKQFSCPPQCTIIHVMYDLPFHE